MKRKSMNEINTNKSHLVDNTSPITNNGQNEYFQKM